MFCSSKILYDLLRSFWIHLPQFLLRRAKKLSYHVSSGHPCQRKSVILCWRKSKPSLQTTHCESTEQKCLASFRDVCASRMSYQLCANFNGFFLLFFVAYCWLTFRTSTKQHVLRLAGKFWSVLTGRLQTITTFFKFTGYLLFTSYIFLALWDSS